MAKKVNKDEKIIPEKEENTLMDDVKKVEATNEVMADLVKKSVITTARASEAIITGMIGSDKWKEEGYTQEVQAELDEAFRQRGIDEATQERVMKVIQGQIDAAVEPTVELEMSPIFNSLGWYPVLQTMIENDVQFNFLSKLMPIKVVENGKELKFYSDNSESDNIKGYEVPKTAQEYYDNFINEATAITTEEEWKTTLNIHKGILVPSIALNDFTSKEAIFLALYDNYTKQISTPINRAFYRLRLLILQDPKEMKNVDWTKITIDKEITGTTVVEGWEKLKVYLDSLTQPSRKNQPTRYIPQGFTQPLELALNPSEMTLVLPLELKNYLELQVRAGLFNQKFVDISPTMQAIDYEKSFVEYTKSTNVRKEANDCIMFLIPKECVEIIQHYKSTRGQNLLVMFYVSHVFIRVGRAINKNKPVFNISFKITEPEKEGK